MCWVGHERMEDIGRMDRTKSGLMEVDPLKANTQKIKRKLYCALPTTRV